MDVDRDANGNERRQGENENERRQDATNATPREQDEELNATMRGRNVFIVSICFLVPY